MVEIRSTGRFRLIFKRDMITQEQLIELSKEWKIDWKPEYRRFICCDCHKTIAKAWHIWFTENSFIKEAHLCRKCGLKYEMK